MIILGRSIGSGPAVLLATQRNCAAMLLFAPFKSLRDVVSANNSLGVGVIAPNIFNNKALISQVDCSTFIVHGTNDELVPLSHSEELFEQSGALPMSKKLHIVEGMTHRDFNVIEDFVKPSTQFLTQRHIICGVAYGKPIDAYHIKQNATPPDAMRFRGEGNYD